VQFIQYDFFGHAHASISYKICFLYTSRVSVFDAKGALSK
jgi:hypothetical protein